jgi:hypothetical protein
MSELVDRYWPLLIQLDLVRPAASNTSLAGGDQMIMANASVINMDEWQEIAQGEFKSVRGGGAYSCYSLRILRNCDGRRLVVANVNPPGHPGHSYSEIVASPDLDIEAVIRRVASRQNLPACTVQECLDALT